jgi:hypothetical protein
MDGYLDLLAANLLGLSERLPALCENPGRQAVLRSGVGTQDDGTAWVRMHQFRKNLARIFACVRMFICDDNQSHGTSAQDSGLALMPLFFAERCPDLSQGSKDLLRLCDYRSAAHGTLQV